jgi:hypothetical protein
MRKRPIRLVTHEPKDSINVLLYGEWESCKEVANKLLEIEGETFSYFGSTINQHYIPIRMTTENRPNKTTPEYKKYIQPWLNEMHREKTRKTEILYDEIIYEEKKKLIDECINTLRDEYRQIDPNNDIDIAEAKGIQIAINLLTHKKYEI